MKNTESKNFSFADFELDSAKRRLLKQGETVALNPKTLKQLAESYESYRKLQSCLKSIV